MNILKNRFFIIGNVLLILIALPLTLFFIRRAQELRGKAAPTTKLSFDPESIQAAPGQEFSLDVMVDPDQNIVSIVDMHITFDQEKLEIVNVLPNQIAFPFTLRGPIYTTGAANISLNIGADVTRAVQSVTKVSTVTFKPKPTVTVGDSSQISFDSIQTRVFSLSSTDEPGENVLQNTTPATVTFVAGTAPTITPSPTSGIISPTPTSPTTTPSANKSPICINLAIDGVATGSAPFSVTFRANGNDSDGKISKASFNFGDSTVQDVTVGGGIGTNAVSVQSTHTYNIPGTFQASATLTDDRGGVSNSCSAQSITVVQPTPTPTPLPPTPTLPPPGGIGSTLVITGAIALTVVGGILLLTL